jgi:hypothetical protein
VRKGNVIKTLHLKHDGAPFQSVLVVLLPGRLGLFSPAVLKGKTAAGGLESLEPDANTKLACVLSADELSAGATAERDPRSHLFANLLGAPFAPGSVSRSYSSKMARLYSVENRRLVGFGAGSSSRTLPFWARATRDALVMVIWSTCS